VKLNNSPLRTLWEDRDRRIVLWLCLFLIISIAAVYGQAVGFGFVDYDDHLYVSDNPKVPGGLSWDGIKWAFTTMYGSNWIPLTWLSLMIDRQIFGPGAGGFHLVNMLFHIVNTVLLFLVLKRYSRSLWPSFFVAALFGLHPLHVESVAWVTERKDVLSTLFWMLTMLAYVRYAESSKGRAVKWYFIMLVFFALGLMTKPMLVTLPFVLLVMDYWPLRRLWPEETVAGAGAGRLVLEKTPMFVLSVMSSVMTFLAQRAGGAVARFNLMPLGERVANAVVSYCSYILKMFYPVGLVVFYPHPRGAIDGWKVTASIVVLMGVTVAVVLLRRRRYLLAGWLWYLGTLVPVVGLIQVGAQAMADRYTYIPLTGIFIMLVWLVDDLVSGWRSKGPVISVVGVAILGVLCVLTFRQVGYWRDTITLFTHAADVTTDNYVAHSNLGVALAEKGEIAAAMREFETVLKMKPEDVETLFNVAKGLALQGKTDEAIEYYNQVLDLAPGDAETYGALALMQVNSVEFERAIEFYREGLRHNPEDGGLHGGLGSLYLQMGRIDEAIAELETAVKLKADSGIYVNLGLAISARGEGDRAMKCFEKAIRLNPANAVAHYNLGNIYLAQGRLAGAVAEYKKAVGKKPDYVKAYGNLAVAMAQTGKLDEAIENFRRVAHLEPNSPDAHYNLAAALVEKGLIGEAVGNLKKVVELVPEDLRARCVLAELLLRQGRVEQAVAEYEDVLKIDPDNEQARHGLQKARETQSGAEGRH